MKIMNLLCRPAAVAAVALVASGALQAAEPKDSKVANTPRAQERLVREIRHELVTLPYYGVFDDLSYQVSGSTVKLTGQVRSLGLKNAAERAVKDIEGVEKVDNQIEMLPPNTTDDQLRLAIFRAIYGQPSLQRYAIQAVPPIHIIVKNGQVTLTGVVLNDGDKNIAKIQANNVPGTFSVTDQLRVEKPAEQ